eukprot:TRINITY_DN48848_c0_g1_i1.p1 TRINITY_DN48848_c0_g1~~TRINITY_DN48848_c0_g1_i1.p1  ORF type:complete len:227 (-),score=20.34 TRINITY_DN48848_c0_g1_i1:70-750(-)
MSVQLSLLGRSVKRNKPSPLQLDEDPLAVQRCGSAPSGSAPEAWRAPAGGHGICKLSSLTTASSFGRPNGRPAGMGRRFSGGGLPLPRKSAAQQPQTMRRTASSPVICLPGTPSTPKRDALLEEVLQATLTCTSLGSLGHSPLATDLELQDRSGKQLRKRVVFCATPQNSHHCITPYSKIYGQHPAFFEFDRKGEMRLNDRGIMEEMRQQEHLSRLRIGSPPMSPD